MLTFHKSIIVAASVFVSILSITSVVDAATQVAVPAPVFHGPPNFISVPLPLRVDQIASDLGLAQMLPKLVLNDATLAHKLGFSSSREIIDLAIIGEPLPVYIVKLDDLKNLMLTQPAIFALLKNQENLVGPLPGLLLTQLPVRLLYPILVGGKAKSCMEVVFSSQKAIWRINTFGMPELCIRVQQFRTADTKFVLRVPALNRDYLGSFDPPSPLGSTEAFGFIALFKDTIGVASGVVSLAPGDSILGSLFFRGLKDEAININPQRAR